MNHKRIIIVVALVTMMLMLSGCAILRPTPSISVSELPVMRLLYYTRALQMASPSGRMAMLANARAAYAEHATAENVARLALAYGQPGYKGYAPENGWRYAQKALANDDKYWGPAAVAFLHQFSALCADNDEVRSQLDVARQNKHETMQQLTQLKKLLTQTQRKLQALTRIESKLNP